MEPPLPALTGNAPALDAAVPAEDAPAAKPDAPLLAALGAPLSELLHAPAARTLSEIESNDCHAISERVDLSMTDDQ